MSTSLSFTSRVHAVVRAIPAGHVMTYQEVARRAGSPGAARAVGTLMRHNHDSDIPCHRVIRSDGFIGQYNNGGPAIKCERLIAEGVQVVDNRVTTSRGKSI